MVRRTMIREVEREKDERIQDFFSRVEREKVRYESDSILFSVFSEYSPSYRMATIYEGWVNI